MDRGQIEEVTAAGDAAPVGAPAAAVERGDAPLGAGADPASLPPPPPPARAAVEVAPAAVADEVVVVPAAAAAAAAAPWYKVSSPAFLPPSLRTYAVCCSFRLSMLR
jgi:hypothetical protein